MIPRPDSHLLDRLNAAEALWLFLDYDGTLADFAPTPDIILPDQALIGLVNELAAIEQNRVTIISGRRLTHIRALLPLSDLMMAGSYGMELQLPGGELVQRLSQASIRPVLDTVKASWQQLLAGRTGFFLEDKGWTLAIHAKDAAAKEADHVLPEARNVAAPAVSQSDGALQLLGGHRFLEIAPTLASKRLTVEYLLNRYPLAGGLPLYLGDDDKDEVAFEAVQDEGGLAIAVGERLSNSAADYLLPSPQAARQWLAQLLASQRGRLKDQGTAA